MKTQFKLCKWDVEYRKHRRKARLYMKMRQKQLEEIQDEVHAQESA